MGYITVFILIYAVMVWQLGHVITIISSCDSSNEVTLQFTLQFRLLLLGSNAIFRLRRYLRILDYQWITRD